MTGPEELIYAAAFAAAMDDAGSRRKSYPAEYAQMAVQRLREISSNAPANRNAWERMLVEFREGTK